MKSEIIDGENLTIEAIIRVARSKAQVELSDTVEFKLKECQNFIEEACAQIL